MKVILTENRLENVIFKYLDNKLKDVEQIEGQYFDVLFRLPDNQFGIMGYNPSKNVLEIHHKFIDDIFSIIPIQKTKIVKLIANYVENKYNVNFTNVKTPLYKSELWR